MFTALSTPEARRLKAWLIDLREGDVPDTDEAMLGFFSGLKLVLPTPPAPSEG